jgi:hypothetical protein
MTEIQRESRRLLRLMGRGRDEATPFYVNVAVLLAVGVAAGLLIGIAFAVYELA